MLTVQKIQARVRAIKASADDFEKAHSLEDDLYCDTLQAIADGADNAAGLARAALKAASIRFQRACS
jgi:hypothetical protein